MWIRDPLPTPSSLPLGTVSPPPPPLYSPPPLPSFFFFFFWGGGAQCRRSPPNATRQRGMKQGKTKRQFSPVPRCTWLTDCGRRTPARVSIKIVPLVFIRPVSVCLSVFVFVSPFLSFNLSQLSVSLLKPFYLSLSIPLSNSLIPLSISPPFSLSIILLLLSLHLCLSQYFWEMLQGFDHL